MKNVLQYFICRVKQILQFFLSMLPLNAFKTIDRDFCELTSSTQREQQIN